MRLEVRTTLKNCVIMYKQFEREKWEMSFIIIIKYDLNNSIEKYSICSRYHK